MEKEKDDCIIFLFKYFQLFTSLHPQAQRKGLEGIVTEFQLALLAA